MVPQNLPGDQRQRACCIASISSGKPVKASWGSWAALLEDTSRDLRFEDRISSLNAQLLWEAAVSSAPRLLLHRCLSPACHTFQAGFALLVAGPAPCDTSLRRGCPLCCGCFKGPRPVLDSGVASWALSQAQPAQAARSMGSQERGTDL